MREQRDRAIDMLNEYVQWRTGDRRFSGEITIRWRDGRPRKDKVVLSRVD